jgi:sugar (pentulose or hexulose) kinase
MSVVAVLDVGKTNAKLVAIDDHGRMVDWIATPNRAIEGPPYRHHDLAGLEDWVVDALGGLARRHAVSAIVPCGHGGSGVLVDDEGPALPMIDYEQRLPPAIEARYPAVAGSFRERGSGIMLGAAHAARQLLWIEQEWPDALDRARAYLYTPQYWAWRLSGVMANEVTSAAAQSHLWSTPDRASARIVERQGWQRLMPPMQPAWAALGPLRPAIAAHAGLDPATPVHCGIHDSSANFYHYQAGGLSDMVVVSTGTWIVALTDRTEGADFDLERPGRTLNADVTGAPVPGMLTMGGREFAAVADGAPGPADRATLGRLVAGGTMALPFFGFDDGLLPGRARRGRVVGPLAADGAARFTLAVLYAALLTAEVVEALPRARNVVLDGTFARDPLYGALVQALLPEAVVLVNPETAGVAAGAALLASHSTRCAPVPLGLGRPDVAGLPELASYRARWRDSLILETQP